VTVTPLGAVSRPEYALDGFEEEQGRFRQRLPLRAGVKAA